MKKIISLIIAMLMLITSFTSCWTNREDGSNTQGGTGTASQNTKAEITKLTINDKEQPLDQFIIEYTLSADEVKIPVVAAEKSDGEGELIIEQATTIPGTATVTLNEVKYMISFKSDFIYEESVLQNTYHRLVSEKRLNVAYIGGSVTVGAFGDAGKSFRDLTTKWFKEHFDARIVETAAGIGGTGSFWGAYRAIQHLHLDSKTARPDLVFIDFAINDYYDGTSIEDIKRYAETLIHEIYRSNPHADIVILILGEQSTTDYDQMKAWRAVAEHYKLPVVELTKNLLEDMRQNGKPWSYYIADVVHPNNNGYARYASYIAELLQAELLDKQVSPFVSNEKELPETTISETLLSDLAYYEVYNLAIPASSGFQPHNVSDETGRGLAANTVGATLNFTFSGTGLALSLGSRDSIVVEYTIDGVKYDDLDVSKRLDPVLAEGLEDGTHTVSLRIKTKSSGSFYIKRILVQGNTSREAIKILSN